jgi:hypothetical protein
MNYSSDPKPFWITELMVVFAAGFALASALWLGVWFLQARPAQADAIDQRDEQLAACRAARNELQMQHEQLLAAKQRLDGKLHDAQLGWGRCIRSQRENETADNSATRPASQP